MKRYAVALSALTFAALGFATAANATTMNVANTRFNGTLQQCLERGRQALAQLGYSALSSTPAAAWAEIQPGDILVAVYCLPEYSVAVVSAAGPSSANTEQVVNAVVDALEGRGGRGGTPGGGK